jgi:hypothetical protein
MRERCAGRWQAPIGAAEHPVELEREPAGPPVFEYWQWRTAHRAHSLVVIRGDQPFQPVSSRGGIVVEECEHLPARDLGRGVASGAKMTIVLVWQDSQRHRPCWAPFSEVVFALAEQFLIVIDAHDDLDRWCGLGIDRRDRLLEL